MMRANDITRSFDKNLSGDRNILVHSQDGLLREVVLRVFVAHRVPGPPRAIATQETVPQKPC
jgi:hypothetical protein